MMTPQQFLRELGIAKRPLREKDSEEYWDEVVRAGFKIPEVAEQDYYAPGFNNPLFANEAVARSTLTPLKRMTWSCSISPCRWIWIPEGLKIAPSCVVIFIAPGQSIHLQP
jgi:hypothetical protein